MNCLLVLMFPRRKHSQPPLSRGFAYIPVGFVPLWPSVLVRVAMVLFVFFFFFHEASWVISFSKVVFVKITT